MITEYEKGALRADSRCSNAGNQEGYVELPLLHYFGHLVCGRKVGCDHRRMCRGISDALGTLVRQPDFVLAVGAVLSMPGLGMALAGAFLLMIWLYWCGYGPKMHKTIKGMLTVTGLLTLVSLKYFPWDFVQRLGAPFLRFVGLLETPGVFWMLANILFTIPAAWTIGELRKKQDVLWRWVIPAIFLIAALATALYLCNGLTYTRLSLGQQSVSELVY